MAASSTCREIGDYVIDKDDRNCLGRSPKVCVYPGKHKTINLNVAGKMFLWDKRYSADMVEDEVAVMESIPPHENVLKMFDRGTVEIGRYKELWLILERCELGHLGEFAYRESLSLVQKVDLMLQASRGVHHLHHLAPPVIHRDIKPANLLISGTPGQPVLKVADFGESRYFNVSHEDSVRNITAGGTRFYQAPELFTGVARPEQNKAVDIFALGVSFQDLLEAQMGVDSTPMTVGDEVLGEHLRKNPRRNVLDLLTKPDDSADVREVKTLISEMLAPHPANRITIDEVVLRLRELRTRLGMKVLVSVDTVWKKPVFYFDKELMRTIQANIESEKSAAASGSDEDGGRPEPQQHPATPEPPERNARLRMDRAEKVLSDTKHVLDQLSRLRVEGRQLLAVSVNEYDNRGVWVHEGSELERVCDVDDECGDVAVCLCKVTDGFLACGGYRKVQLSPHTHHFSLLTRQWKKLANMNTPRYFASAVEYDAMKVLVAGGQTSDGKDSAVCEVIECKGNAWDAVDDMPKSLWKPLMASEAGQVYILEQSRGLQKHQILIVDPSSRKQASGQGILKRSSSKSPRYTSALPEDVRDTRGACLAAADQRLYVLGGEERLALCYNLLTKQWERLTPPSLRYNWMHGCCAVVAAARITVYGGSSTEGREKCNRAEVYDTRARKWHTLDMRLPFGYSKHTDLVARYNE